MSSYQASTAASIRARKVSTEGSASKVSLMGRGVDAVVVSEIIGPAGNDMQMLPPTVAVFQILNEARKARQHWPINGAAAHSTGGVSASSCAMVQVAAISSPSARACSGGQPRVERSLIHISEPTRRTPIS